MEDTKEVKEKVNINLEEERLRELRKELLEKVEDKVLEEYTSLYMIMVLKYSSTLKINFDNLK
tara:strand:- start:286 stop:474 length:189 start_codon:yes stop_codon:yes gene_type:complete